MGKIQLAITEMRNDVGGNAGEKPNTWFRGENCIWLVAGNSTLPDGMGHSFSLLWCEYDNRKLFTLD